MCRAGSSIMRAVVCGGNVSAAAGLVDGAGELRLRRRRLFGVVWSSVTVVGPPRVRWPRVAVGRRSVTVCWRWRMVMVHVARGDGSGRV